MTNKRVDRRHAAKTIVRPTDTVAGAQQFRTARSRDRNRRIREAATALFLEHGYDGVSIDDVVRRVGGSKATVYSQFTNKEALFVTVIEDLSDEFVAELKAVSTSRMGLENGLRRIANKLLEILLRPRHLAYWRLIVSEAARIPEVTRAWFRHGPAASSHFIAGFIAHHQQTGTVRRIDPEQAATLFHDMAITSIFHRAVIGDTPSEAEIESTVNLAVKIFVHGTRS
ncbi:MAG: TetR/AcrR family transcriptional regulator [Pseudomonadota bacterium]|jgi:AcrR family transcriptional regulator|nr:TetR/AcrR family transcriptional regulator [Pseudomonadota bacterium]